MGTRLVGSNFCPGPRGKLAGSRAGCGHPDRGTAPVATRPTPRRANLPSLDACRTLRRRLETALAARNLANIEIGPLPFFSAASFSPAAFSSAMAGPLSAPERGGRCAARSVRSQVRSGAGRGVSGGEKKRVSKTSYSGFY